RGGHLNRSTSTVSPALTWPGCWTSRPAGVIGLPSHHPVPERTTMADEIRAEMVANVWKVVKAAGDTVEEGDTLVSLDARKVEIALGAQSGGTVAQIAVNEGDVVQEGDLIAVVE